MAIFGAKVRVCGDRGEDGAQGRGAVYETQYSGLNAVEDFSCRRDDGRDKALRFGFLGGVQGHTLGGMGDKQFLFLLP